MYRLVVLLHIAGVFGFLMAHGVSAGASFQLRKERAAEPARALVELSTKALYYSYGFLLATIASGVLLGFLGAWWRQYWIWVSIGVLLALIAAMGFLAGGYHRSRKALGIGYFTASDKVIDPDPKVLTESLAAARPGLLLVVGVIGLLALLWLMVFKPF